MKFLCSLLFFLITIGLKAQQSSNIDLNIILSNDLEIPTKANLTLSYFDKSNSIENVLPVSNRQIHFKRIEKEPVLADLYLIWPNKKSIKIRFLLPVDTGIIAINDYNKVNITFRNQQELYQNFSLMNREIAKIQQASTARIKALNFENREMSSVQKEIDSLNEHYERLIDNVIYKKIITEDKRTFLGVVALTSYAERPYGHQRRKFQADSLLAEYKLFTPEMQNLPTMQAFQKLLLAEKQIVEGQLFPLLTLRDTLNQAKNISKLYSSKYTLIDIWANWCVPCRDEHPNLLQQYKKYKQKGLEIISVSIDKLTDSYLWKEAIKNDKIGIWTHFIDTDGKAKEELKIRFIPANFIIDDKGNIVAKYLSGEKLNEKLKVLFDL